MTGNLRLDVLFAGSLNSHKRLCVPACGFSDTVEKWNGVLHFAAGWYCSLPPGSW